MRFLSFFSGIEAASCAWIPLGWECVAVSEIDRFATAVLAHHYPTTPNLGDMTAVDWSRYRGECDLVVGGPPCQAFSVAGLRRSLADARGNLSLEYVRAIHAIEPRWSVTENVPGWLSTKDNAFGCFLGALVGSDSELVPARGQRWTDAGLVAGPRRVAAWRILDAQYFGVPQRRRRVFVVSSPRDNGDPAAVLFERASLRGDPAPSREARQDVAGGACAGTLGCSHGNVRADEAWTGRLIPKFPPPLKARDLRGLDSGCDGAALLPVAHALRAEGFDASEDGTGRGTPLVPLMAAGCCGSNGAGVGQDGDPAFTLDTTGAQAICFDEAQVTSPENRSQPAPGREAHCLSRENAHRARVATAMAVRRLTPEECEKLQGFSPGYTAVPYRNKPACDGPRYKALGNSMAVPVMRWVGERIAMVEAARPQSAP